MMSIRAAAVRRRGGWSHRAATTQEDNDMRYLILIYGDPALSPDYTTAEGQAEMAEWNAFTEGLVGSGALVAGEALQPVETATTVRKRDERVLHSDGPFAETKEVLGGFYLIDVPSLDEALGWAAKIPSVHYGSIEVRPVVDFSGGDWGEQLNEGAATA
jgi:hypothetical protein